jgi:hypothetical protein
MGKSLLTTCYWIKKALSLGRQARPPGQASRPGLGVRPVGTTGRNRNRIILLKGWRIQVRAEQDWIALQGSESKPAQQMGSHTLATTHQSDGSRDNLEA